MKRSLTFLMFLICNAVFAQQNVLTPQDVARIEYVINTSISPDGEKIVYQHLKPMAPQEKNAPADVHLYLYDKKSNRTMPFITGYSVSNVKFRPRHNSISFTAKKDGDKFSSLYEIGLNGGEAQKIYEFNNSITHYDWHPQGSKLLFVSHEPKESRDSQLPYQPEVYEEGLRESTLYTIDLSSPSPASLTVDGHVTGAWWSPDGQKMAVSAAPSSLVDDFYTGQKIYILDAASQNVSAQVDHKAKLGILKWSPDSKKIAFIAGEDQHDPIDGRIFIVDATGGTPSNLNPTFKGKFEDLAWKDNNTLTYLASEGVYSSIGTIGRNGKMNQMFRDDNLSIAGLSMAKNGSMALVGSTARHPGELFTLDAKGANANRVTNSNPWLEQEKLGKQEVITYKAADGMEIEGILIHPVSGEEKTPLITVVHGGPEAHYDNGWLTNYSMPGQMGAGEGYAVFYPNYRGSTGRGAEFAKSSQGDPGGKEFDDIIDGVDYLIENKNVDRDRVGVTGGSYGGYATAWMATRHTERFAAGVMSVGISNNLSKWGTSDIPEEMFLVHSRKRIWDDYQFFLERSPIFYADQAKTPLLILHGKEDTRVDPGQSYELYRHIKTRTETPVRLVLYPGEGHGNRKSTARYDYSLRMMRWFNTYLKEGNQEIPKVEVSPGTK
ncbi:S9 family peptidase [Salinimicrobium sediminilitoris]|uniref:S9 family peptidase n=1 Tax=Salinimicrobium sediminilitoris TaxID=2876715 RepID=UPI001E58C8F0|nr:S9 family peptidase [Salinimicrobium sediminilitoris]MCC8360683.1 S9 family peptidase [Salinimicrobium sediminilitoris]